MVFEPRTETDAPAFFDTFGMLQHGLRCYRTSPVLTARGAYSVYWGLLGVLVGQVAGFRAGGEIDVVEGGLVRRCRANGVAVGVAVGLGGESRVYGLRMDHLS